MRTGAEVGGARVDVAKLGRDLEVLAGLGLHGVTHGLDAAGQALEHTLQCKDKKTGVGWNMEDLTRKVVPLRIVLFYIWLLFIRLLQYTLFVER